MLKRTVIFFGRYITNIYLLCHIIDVSLVAKHKLKQRNEIGCMTYVWQVH